LNSAERQQCNQAGAYSSRATGPDGSVSVFTRNADGSVETSALGCGMTQTRTYALEPLWSYLYLKSVQERTPAGLSRGSAVSRLYADTNADTINDLITDSISVNGRVATQVTETLTGTLTQTTPAGRQSTLRYDPATLLTQEIAVPGLTPATYGYDSRGRMTSAAVGSRVLRLAYDQNGNPDYLVTPDERTFDYSYDIMGRLLAETRPDGSEVDYQYDANGNLTALVNPNAVPYVFGYTANNQRRSLAAPLSGTYQYLYDRDRRLKTVTFPSGRQILNAYAAGVLDYTITPEGTIDYDYACSAKLTHAARGGEGVSFAYDGTFVTTDTRAGTLSKTIGYTYDNDFALSSMSYADVTIRFGYDADGLLTSADGYTIARSAQNGLPLSVSGNGMTQGRTFSGYGEMDGSAWTAGTASPYQWNVARDAAGRIVQRTEVIDGETVNWEYAYDTLGRLTAVQRNSALVESYSYDANGNRLSEMNSLRGLMDRSYTNSVEDHLLTAGSDSYVFDVDGFLQSKTSAEGTTVYDYSSRGELQRVDLPDGGIVTYLNDPFGRRIAKQINGTTVEKYLWAGQTTLLAVYDGSDNLLQRYTYADARMPVSMTAGGATYHLLTDQVGTLRAVADTTGAIVKRIDYDSFGNILSDSNPSFTVPFGFAGGLHDRDTGLVRFGFRDYSPELGRFVAKDPLDFGGGDTNLYSYALNDPVNMIDPNGLDARGLFPDNLGGIGSINNTTTNVYFGNASTGQHGTSQVIGMCGGQHGGNAGAPRGDVDFIYATPQTPINGMTSGAFKIGANDATLVPNPLPGMPNNARLSNFRAYWPDQRARGLIGYPGP
jgi:RHS repeat-associated protein